MKNTPEKQTFSSSWETDDQQFRFQFDGTVEEFSIENQERVQTIDMSIKIYYISIIGENILVWDQDNIQPPKTYQLNLANLYKGVDTTLTGIITIQVQYQTEKEFLVVLADISVSGKKDDFDFEGPIFVYSLKDIPVVPPIPPKPKPDPIPDPEPFIPNPRIEPNAPIIIQNKYEDLFPYTYMKNWVEPSEKEITLNFISYTPSTISPPITYFYDQLKQFKAQKDRDSMEKEAAKFIEGEDPYTNQFVDSIESLSVCLRYLKDLVLDIRYTQKYNEIIPLMCLWTQKTPEELKTYFNSEECKQEVENIWLSYFALMIELGYRTRFLENLTLTLIGVNIVTLLINQESQPTISKPFTSLEIRQLLYASIILPNDIFPLPDDENINTLSVKLANEWIEPYAIGDLQLVRQTLLRYEAGEIASITNVMPGEKKRIVKRAFKEQTQRKSEEKQYDESNQQVDRSLQNTFEKEVSQALAEWEKKYDYKDITNTYTPPNNINIGGSYTIDKTSKTPRKEDISTFAKQILNRTTKKITEKVSRLRWEQTRNETEDIEESELDNTHGSQVIQGVYRWLNKIYEASVVNIGNRLVIAFSINYPAENYIVENFNLSGNFLVEPKDPKLVGITNFKDITLENYNQLCAIYQVDDVILPPSNFTTVSETLTGNEIKSIMIPEGYQADSYTLTYIKSPFVKLVYGLIGQNSFTITEDYPSSGKTTYSLDSDSSRSGSLSKENKSVPFAAYADLAMASPPEISSTFLVTAEVICTLTDNEFMRWQLAMYQKVIEAYQDLKKQYYEYFDNQQLETQYENPAQNRVVIIEELKRQCVQLLLEYIKYPVDTTTTQGINYSPPASSVDIGRYIQFIEEVFEWGGISYSFTDSYVFVDQKSNSSKNIKKYTSQAASNGDHLFTAFLQADKATVFLPVRPEDNHKLLFFLEMGMIWVGADDLVPLLNNQVGIINSLKKLIFSPKQPEIPENVVDSWEMIVPTSLQVLNNEINLLNKI